MPDDLTPERDELLGEYRSLTTDIAVVAAAVATPAAIVAQPVVAAWANQHFSQDDKPKADPPPQEPEK